MRIILAIERTDDNKSGVGIALEVLEFANNIINTAFSRIFAVRNNLQVVKTNDRGGVVGAERE